MIGQTYLNDDDANCLIKVINGFSVGESAQDQFLEKLVHNLGEIKLEDGTITKASLHYQHDKYSAFGNYRFIKSSRNYKNLAFAFFDVPLIKSPVFVGTKVPELKLPLLKAYSDLSFFKYFRATPINDEHLTLKTIRDISKINKIEAHKSLSSKQTLEYFYDNINKYEKLFEVIDSDDIPVNFLNQIFEKK